MVLKNNVKEIIILLIQYLSYGQYSTHSMLQHNAMKYSFWQGLQISVWNLHFQKQDAQICKLKLYLFVHVTYLFVFL